MMRSMLLLSSLVLAGPAFAQSGCEGERGAKSEESSAATQVVFNNRSAKTMKVYWLDYDGRRTFYADVGPGKLYSQDTYMTHPWVVTDNAKRCVMMFRPMPGATLATITD